MKASDYEKQKCFVSKTWQMQHKNSKCRYLKNRQVIETDRRKAYVNGAKNICVHCWWEKEPSSLDEIHERLVRYETLMHGIGVERQKLEEKENRLRAWRAGPKTTPPPEVFARDE